MFKRFVVFSLVLVIVLVASGCGANNGSAYLGRWENTNVQDDDSPGIVETNYIDSFSVAESGDHYVFNLLFTDDSSMSVSATYEDGYFTLQMPGYTWSAFYDENSGHLILNNQQFRRVN